MVQRKIATFDFPVWSPDFHLGLEEDENNNSSGKTDTAPLTGCAVQWGLDQPAFQVETEA